MSDDTSRSEPDDAHAMHNRIGGRELERFNSLLQTFRDETLETQEQKDFLDAILTTAWRITAAEAEIDEAFAYSFTPQTVDLVFQYAQAPMVYRATAPTFIIPGIIPGRENPQ